MTSIADRYAQITQQAEQRTTRTSQVTPASPKQSQYLVDLRTRFSISTEGIEALSFQEVRAEIEVLRARPMPPSPAQMDVIHKTIKELQESGMNINISAEKIASLTGGREGTGSKMIEYLFTLRQDTADVAALSDAQATTISGYYFCPDIAFEDYDVQKRIMMPAVSEKAWRRMTEDEFMAEIKSKFTRQQASKFIDDNREVFYTWKRTRITSNQMKYVRELDERLAKIYTSKQVNFAVVDGEIIEVDMPTAGDRMPTRAHEPLTEQDLQQLSFEEASTLIDQMRHDLNRTFESESDTTQQELQDKLAGFSERNGTGNAKNEADAMSLELVKLGDLIYKLEAVVGSESPELHDMVKEVFIHQVTTADVLVEELRDFMSIAIDDSSDTRLKQSYGALMNMCEDIPLAMRAVSSL